MTRRLTLLLLLLTVSALSQTGKYKTFRKADYPVSKYLVKTDAFDFAGLRIELIQVKLRDYRTYDSTKAYCRIWLTVKRDGATVDGLFINDCEALGGCSGIYVSKQERKDYFILSKFGDYNGQLLIVDRSGKIRSFAGGHYFLSADNRYLFSPYDSDLSGLTVFDFSQNKALFTSDDLPMYLADWYQFGRTYFAIVGNDVKKGAGRTEIATYDFKTNKLVRSTVNDSYIAKAKRLKSRNVFEYAPCNCGQTKKQAKR